MSQSFGTLTLKRTVSGFRRPARMRIEIRRLTPIGGTRVRSRSGRQERMHQLLDVVSGSSNRSQIELPSGTRSQPSYNGDDRLPRVEPERELCRRLRLRGKARRPESPATIRNPTAVDPQYDPQSEILNPQCHRSVMDALARRRVIVRFTLLRASNSAVYSLVCEIRITG